MDKTLPDTVQLRNQTPLSEESVEIEAQGLKISRWLTITKRTLFLDGV